MRWLIANVWLIPLLPLAASACIAVLPRGARRPAQALAIGSMMAALALSIAVFGSTLGDHGVRATVNFDWFRVGTGAVRLGWVFDPLGAVMLVMVSLVGLLIFIFSTGYMAEDNNGTRFFCFLALFASAMLGLVIANSLLLLFACWELMGLASYLLIGFWFEKPSAAAAAKKAFIVTRIGDLGLFLGMLWLYRESGTLLFYDQGRGCLEAPALAGLAATFVPGTIAASTAIGLLLFVGAMGKSGQVPLHVWLPDAMEGPTPVSALIHAATMVAAGVFLVARVFPIMTGGVDGPVAMGASPALQVVTGVGSVTALLAALMAVGQSDIKRVLAYSTVSQLGYMFLGLGTGGVAVGMFHLITHAFFKALLFLGAGSVIHGCHHEQDIRRLGGLRRRMPVTFATYAVGMMALSGVPLLFSGFWSKDEILHAAWLWQPSRWPFFLGLAGAFLTAFYMTRQVAEVFLGPYRGGAGERPTHPSPHTSLTHQQRPDLPDETIPSPAIRVDDLRIHESPASMTVPLVILSVFAILLGLLGTPAWPWFEAYLAGHVAVYEPALLARALPMMLISTGVVSLGLGLGWWLYVRRPRESEAARDPLEVLVPRAFAALRQRLYVDELYAATVVRAQRGATALASMIDWLVLGGLVTSMSWAFRLLAWVLRWMDELFVNAGFDAGCEVVRMGGRVVARVQSGRAQGYLRLMGLGMVVLALVALWGLRTP